MTRSVGALNYEVATPGGRKGQKVYHINLLKKWHKADEVSHAFLAQFEGEDMDADFLPVLREEPQNQHTPTRLPQLSEEKQLELEAVLERFPDVFREVPGRTTVTSHAIHVGDAVPIRQRAYRIPYAQSEVVQGEIEKMLEAKVIIPSKSLWASPIVIVGKKDGGVRFCVDYRKLNQVAKLDAYPMPRIDEVIDKISPAKYITTLDLAKGYWQIPLSPESKEKTAFVTPFGLYEFEVMPFGLHNAPATFQRMMDHVLQGCESFAGAYLDDVIFSLSWEEHLKHLAEVLSRLHEAGLTVKPQKCQFAQQEVHYQGHIIGRGKVRPDPAKIASVKDCPKPQTKKDVRAFLGLTGYYRRFVPSYSTIAALLTDLTKKGRPEKGNWSAECQKAFQKLKNVLIEAPVLIIADPLKQFVLYTDASDWGLGSVLSQVGRDEDKHPVAYASRKLFPREQRYSTIEKECLAIVWSLKLFHTYLLGRQFVIITDHQPLSRLHRMKHTNGRLSWWSLLVQPYSFQIHHRSGSKHGNADGLSRAVRENDGERKNPSPPF